MTTLTLGLTCISKTKCRWIPHNQNSRLFWATKKSWNDAWYMAVWAAVQETKPKPYRHRASIEIVLRTIRYQDYDNAYGSVKPILDGLTRAGVIEDDGPEYIDLVVKQEKVKHRKEQGIEIRLA